MMELIRPQRPVWLTLGLSPAMGLLACEMSLSKINEKILVLDFGPN